MQPLRGAIVKHRQRGFSLLELIIVLAIIAIITMIAIPNVRHIHMQAQETSALKSIDTMRTALQAYEAAYGTFPKQQSDLGPPNGAPPSKTAADLLDSVMAPPGGVPAQKDGYVIRYTAGPADDAGNILTFSVTADPAAANVSGVKRYFTDQNNTIHFTMDGSPATALSPPVH